MLSKNNVFIFSPFIHLCRVNTNCNKIELIKKNNNNNFFNDYAVYKFNGLIFFNLHKLFIYIDFLKIFIDIN